MPLPTPRRFPIGVLFGARVAFTKRAVHGDHPGVISPDLREISFCDRRREFRRRMDFVGGLPHHGDRLLRQAAVSFAGRIFGAQRRIFHILSLLVLAG